MRKNLNVNKIVNEMDYLLYLIMKQEWEMNKDYYLEVLSEKRKIYRCFYFDLDEHHYSSFSWHRKDLMTFIERYNSLEVNKIKLIKKINNAISYFRFPECKHYKMIVEVELLKSICEVERIW
jgi:hypothetical protein